MSTTQRRITLTENADGWWTAHDEVAGLTAQGETRDVALDSLDSVLAATNEEAGRPPTDDELRAAGIDPDENGASDELPDVLQ